MKIKWWWFFVPSTALVHSMLMVRIVEYFARTEFDGTTYVVAAFIPLFAGLTVLWAKSLTE